MLQFFNFHLMPYTAMDLSEIDKVNSAWITLSNRHYDPVKGAEIYHNHLDELELADRLGFDGVAVNEHHQTAYGLMPIPGVLAGALARTVKKAKIAVLGRALPLLNVPLSVAEEYAILDNLTRGRLVAGFVRGIGAEYHSTGANPGESLARFHEAHDLIIQSWTRPGPFSFDGKYYKFRYVNPWPVPYQKPHPPVWIPSQGSRETIEWAAKKRYVYCQTLSPIKTVARFFDLFREAATKEGYQAARSQLAWSNSIYVADTDEQALREAKVHLESLANYFLRMPLEMLVPPGYSSIESLKRVRAMKGPKKSSTTAEQLIADGVVIVGSPSTVREKIEEYESIAGFGTMLIKTQFGTLPHDMAMRNAERLAAEVMPYFRRRDAAAKAPATAAAK